MTDHYRRDPAAADHVIAVINTKGGVGKTTTAVNLAAVLAGHGSVLLVDGDSQAGASLGLGIARCDLSPSLAHVLLYGLPIARAVRPSGVPGIDLITASADLANADLALSDVRERELCLRKLLDPVRRRYSAIVIDCPPGLSLLQLNVLAATDWFLLTITPQYLSLEGVASLLEATQRVRERFNPRLRLLGMLVTMMDRRSKRGQEIGAMLRGHYGGKVFTTEIPYNGAVAEAPSFGKTIFDYAPASPAARAYRRFAVEVLRRMKRAAHRGIREGIPRSMRHSARGKSLK